MALPKAVQAELDQAELIEKQLSGVAEQVTEPPQTEPAQDKPADPVAVQEMPQTPVQDAPHAPDWEQKYNVLRGKYDAEVPRLHAQLREVNGQIQDFQRQIDEMRSKPAPEVKPVDTPLVSEQDKEVFGEDLVNLQERIARAVAAPLEAHIAKLTERLSKYEGTAEQTAKLQAETAEDKFFDRLAREVPNWEQINQDQQWLEWLGGRYPGMSATRQDQLSAARANLDLGSTVELFKAFVDSTAKPTPPSNSQELQRQVAPPKTRASSEPVADSSNRVWTQAEIAAALDPRKLRQMSAAEVERVMSEIDIASAEGRVR